MASTLLNPDTYLNHLQPGIASQFEITRNVYLTILGASIWDVLCYIPNHIEIVTRGFEPITFCFVFSRVFAITYTLLFVLAQTLPIANCMAMNIAMGITYLLTVACTSFLFLWRLHGVYAQQRIVCWIFSFLYLGITGMTVTVIIGVDADHIDGTGYCVMHQTHSYISISEFLPVVFDTLVFLATSYKILSDQARGGAGTRWSLFVNGNLSVVSRALLKGGQQYYMAVVWMTITSGVVLCTSSNPAMYQPMFIVASTTLAASMSCRVFRNMKNSEVHCLLSEEQKISALYFFGGSLHKSKPRSAVIDNSHPTPATAYSNNLNTIAIQQRSLLTRL